MIIKICLAAAAFLAALPASAAQLQTRILPINGAPVRIGLPVRPTPMITIGGPMVRLPGPASPVPVSVPRVIAQLPVPLPPIGVSAAPLPAAAVEYTAELPAALPAPAAPSLPGAKRLPSPAGAVVRKLNFSGDLGAMSAKLDALFDNAKKDSPEPVVVPEKPAPSEKVIQRGRPARPERPLTLPESDLEDEIGISPLGDWR